MLLGADLFGFGAFDLAARCEALVAQNAQRLDFRALAGLAELEHLHIARTGLAVLVHGTNLLGLRAPQHQQFANVLDGRGTQFFRQTLKQGFARSAVV